MMTRPHIILNYLLGTLNLSYEWTCVDEDLSSDCVLLDETTFPLQQISNPSFDPFYFRAGNYPTSFSSTLTFNVIKNLSPNVVGESSCF